VSPPMSPTFLCVSGDRLGTHFLVHKWLITNPDTDAHWPLPRGAARARFVCS
jgi:hypothetical protein